MPEVLEQRLAAPSRRQAERAARRTMLEQIERLEYEQSSLFVSAWPRKGLALPTAPGRGPALLSLAELEQLRDELIGRVEWMRLELAERTRIEEGHRRRIEEMQLEPEKHRWVRIANEDIGEPGCKHWHVRPRWGILGMLMNWWRVRISSGCPLPNRPLHGAA